MGASLLALAKSIYYYQHGFLQDVAQKVFDRIDRFNIIRQFLIPKWFLDKNIVVLRFSLLLSFPENSR